MSSNDPYIRQIQLSIQYIALTFGFPILILGIIGNILNIIVFLHKASYKHNASSFYMLVKSFFDLNVLVISLAGDIIIDGFHANALTSENWCKFRVPLVYINSLCSSSCLCLQAIDSYMCSSRNATIRQYSTIKKARYLIVGFLFVWICNECPYYFMKSANIIPNLTCQTSNTIYRTYRSYFTILVLNIIVPVTIITLFGYLTYKNMHTLNTDGQYRLSTLTKQTIRMALYEIIIVLLFKCPFGIAQIYLVSTANIVKDVYRQTQEQFITLFFYFYVYNANAVPFFCYFAASKSFRKQVIDTIKRIRFNQRTNLVFPLGDTCGGFIRKDDWDISGNDLLSSPVQVTDYASCCTKCQTTSGCKAFAYSPTTKDCWPKTSTGGGGKPEGNRISGYSSNMCGGFIRKDDWDIPGNDLLPSSVQVSDYAGCCVKCQTTSGCKAFAYSPPTKECWLKTSTGNGGFSRSDRISGIDGEIVGATWQEHWFEHNQLLTRVYYDDDLALYYDGDVARSTVPYVSKYLSDAWRYVKRNYGNFGPEERLYAIFHTGRYSGGHPSYYYSASHDFKNVIDQGAGPWFEQLGSMDIPTHEIFHIVEMASFNTQGSPGFGNPPNGLGLTAEAERAKSLSMANSDNFPRPNTYWFRDWLYPWYIQGQETKVLVNYFKLVAQYFPKYTGTNQYARSMNWGEFIHFSSGAAGINMKNQATIAFGWTSEMDNQFNKARSDFAAIIYT
ncbi:unnamed protein product [Adineta steineri]|uniref:Apple domain-containing protein n=1 Tax=Adineta steineri TaxID=433720 RepID=A0A814M473_9BILA|nr:unnamed protein product [Adineta steineri]CAF1075045.1 unnamed protein product [Adineta steineri]